MLTVRAIKPFHGPDGRLVRPGDVLEVTPQRARELEAARRARILSGHCERVRPVRCAQTGPDHTTAASPHHRG